MASWLVLPFLNDVCCRIDPITITLAGSIGVALVSFPLFYLLSTGDNLRVMSLVVLGSYGLAVGIAGSHVYVFVADLFPIHLRALGFGMSFNVAMAFVGGSTPLINAAILETEWTLGVGLYWSLMSAITSVAAAWGHPALPYISTWQFRSKRFEQVKHCSITCWSQMTEVFTAVVQATFPAIYLATGKNMRSVSV